MPSSRRCPRVWRRMSLVLAFLLGTVWLVGCTGVMAPVPSPKSGGETEVLAEAGPSPAATVETLVVVEASPTTATEMTTAAPAGTAEAAVATPLPQTEVTLALPSAFRFELIRRPAGADESSYTVVSGAYRDGDWEQSVQSEDQFAEEMVVAGGDQSHSYTRPSGDQVWTRWPGVGFDAAYGLTSPFAVLRLFPLVDGATPRVLAQVPGAPVATFRTQTVVSAETVDRLLDASVASLTSDAETRATLQAQMAPLVVQQTITFWVGEDERVYKAAATLLASDSSGQPAPWLEVTWRFWAYEDPRINVTIPTELRDAPVPTEAGPAAPTAEVPATQAGLADTLLIHVYASPGVPAELLAVTVYPAGEARQPLDWRDTADASFSLPPGRYDVLIQMDYVQEWLRDLEISGAELVEREIVFDFGVLELTITRAGEMVPVEVVTYPSGDRQNWIDWRSDNPARIQLREGSYDVEIAYADYTAIKTVTGLVVREGETNKVDVVLTP